MNTIAEKITCLFVIALIGIGCSSDKKSARSLGSSANSSIDAIADTFDPANPTTTDGVGEQIISASVDPNTPSTGESGPVNSTNSPDPGLPSSSVAEQKTAFLNILYPVLKAECVACHSQGGYPFASADADVAFDTAMSLIGTAKSNTRIYQKLATTNHPTKLLNEKSTPLVGEAFDKFFGTVRLEVNDSQLLYLAPHRIVDGKTDIPQVSNVGMLIYEFEGATVDPEGKGFVEAGNLSNGQGIKSNAVPAHPISGTDRTYTTNTCEDDTPTITQLAHTGSPSNSGSVKFVYEINTVLMGPDGEPLPRDRNNQFDLTFHLLPDNTPPTGNLPDSMYLNEQNPIVSLETMGLNNGQLSALKAEFEKRLDREHQAIRDRLDRKPNSKGWQDRLALFDSFVPQFKSANTNQLLNFLQVGDNGILRVIGPVNIRYYVIENGQPVEKRRNLHPNENLPLEFVETKFKKQVQATIEFQVKPGTANKLGLEGEELSFRLLTKGLGGSRYRLKDANDEVIRQCAGINNSEGEWTVQNGNINLTPGTYKLEFFMNDQDSILDAMMLIANTVENEIINPDTDQKKLRHPVYGLSGGAIQKPINHLQWDILDGKGIFQMEVEILGGSYAFQNPMVLKKDNSELENVLIDEFCLKINNEKAIIDRHFNFVNDVRPVGAIMTYGRMVINSENPSEMTEVSPCFVKLEESNLEASLPKYVDAPPVQGIKCRAPDVFAKLVMPLYTQQKVIIRQEEDNDGTYAVWRDLAPNYLEENPPEDPDFDDTVTYSTLQQPTIYAACTSCHDAEHEYFPMETFDADTLCNEALSRTNRQQPLNSIAMRGMRGQLGHRPLYAVFDPFSSDYQCNKGNNNEPADVIANYLRTETDNRGEFIFGRMLGDFSTFNGNPANIANNAKRDFLTTPLRVNWNTNPEDVIIPSSQFDVVPGTRTQNSVFKYNDNPGDVLNQHDRVVDCWETNFIKWVNEENRLLELEKAQAAE